MRLTHWLLPISILAIGTGCAATSQQTRRTAPPPPGPAQTGSTQSDVVPAGTELSIRVNQEISTREAGGSFTAQMAQDVVNQNGQVLIPKGSPVKLAVSEVSTGGVTGTRTMSLSLQSVTINGRERQASSQTEEQRGREGLGRNRRTAEMAGGGAALGALLGAIAGGGSGAAAGAAIGAAGGATAQVLTRGDEVRVPAETVLTFKLDQPMHLVS